MKKLTMILSAAVLLFSASAFATAGVETTVNTKVKTAFQKDFSNAANVSWEKTSDFYVASFDVSNTQAEAAYNDQGELVGMSRKIATAELPLAVSLAIAKKYEGYQQAKAAVEITFENATSYYIAVANDKQTLKLKCAANGDIVVESKSKK